MIKTFHILVPILGCLFLSSCNNQEDKKEEIKWNTEKSTNMNRQFSAEEEIEINIFLARKQEWQTTKTGSGLRYFIKETTEGLKPEPEDYVDIEYSITLLDGTEIYRTKSDEVEEIKVDRAQVESGIQEGIKLMPEGSKAILIIPSHLAHGIVGDMSKIPPLSTLIVDIHLIKLYKK